MFSPDQEYVMLTLAKRQILSAAATTAKPNQKTAITAKPNKRIAASVLSLAKRVAKTTFRQGRHGDSQSVNVTAVPVPEIQFCRRRQLDDYSDNETISRREDDVYIEEF
jgi:hypothetical protein